MATKTKGTMTDKEKNLLATLSELGGSRFDDDDLIQEGDKLIIPVGMSMKQAISFLTKKMEAEEETVAINKKFKYRPWDGAHATWKVFKDTFGMVGHRGTPGLFFDNPPEYITINVDVNRTEQVPWGGFSVPLLTGAIFYTGSVEDEELGVLFQLQARTPRKWRSHVEGIFALVEKQLREHSIYLGKAFDGKAMPEFLDLSGVDRDKVVYSQEALTQLEASVWSVMQYTEELRKANIPRKRSALLYGPYGTGKTLAGFLTAQEAVANGWTCIYARPGRDDLEYVMQTARLYQPAVVFAEDLDAVTDPNEGSRDMASRMLDIFDGITAKGTEMLVVLTTNHPERIHKGMLRPGRLDAVIEIGEMDAEGIARLIQVSLPLGTLAPDIAWDRVSEAFAGFLPSYVKEGADRAFRYSLARNNGTIEHVQLSTDDLVHAAEGLRPQLKLMEEAKERGPRDPLAWQIRQSVKEAVVETVNPDAQDPWERPLLVEEVRAEVQAQQRP